MNNNDLIEQLSQYTLELAKIEQLISKQPQHQHLHTLQHKIKMKIAQFNMTIHQLQHQNHTSSGLQQISNFFKGNFTTIIKEAHRLIQIKSRP